MRNRLTEDGTCIKLADFKKAIDSCPYKLFGIGDLVCDIRDLGGEKEPELYCVIALRIDFRPDQMFNEVEFEAAEYPKIRYSVAFAGTFQGDWHIDVNFSREFHANTLISYEEAQITWLKNRLFGCSSES